MFCLEFEEEIVVGDLILDGLGRNYFLKGRHQIELSRYY